MHGERDLAPRRSRLPAGAFRRGVRQPFQRAAHGAHPAAGAGSTGRPHERPRGAGARRGAETGAVRARQRAYAAGRRGPAIARAGAALRHLSPLRAAARRAYRAPGRPEGEPLAVPFGDEAVGESGAAGFDEERAARFFGLFFQLRRAFYFIERSLAGRSESMQPLREALWNNMFTHDMRASRRRCGTGWKTSRRCCSARRAPERAGRGGHRALGFIPYCSGERRFAANFAETFHRHQPVAVLPRR